jgi:predicted flap endonuclease-1-like 5' DNA nuclease
MNYKIIDIEGIGENFASKLMAENIDTVEQLLDRCAAPAGRKELADKTGISEKLILRWTNHADLFRVDGIGPQFAELLEAAGVDTVKELRHRVPANLAAKLVEVNDEKHLCRRVPAESELERMIAQAKELEPRMTY